MLGPSGLLEPEGYEPRMRHTPEDALGLDNAPDNGRGMARPLAVAVFALVVLSGLVIIYRGVATGLWMGGILYGGVLTAGALYTWLSFRANGGACRSAADQMIVLFLVMQSAIALPALSFLEDRIAERMGLRASQIDADARQSTRPARPDDSACPS